MPNTEEFGDLRNEMHKLKKERDGRFRRDQSDGNPTQDLVERTMKVLAPVIDTFVGSDRSLELQSSTSWGFYIVYAYVKVCRLVVSSPEVDTVHIDAEWNSTSHRIYSGTFDDKEIKNVVKSALLNWYSTLL